MDAAIRRQRASVGRAEAEGPRGEFQAGFDLRRIFGDRDTEDVERRPARDQARDDRGAAVPPRALPPRRHIGLEARLSVVELRPRAQAEDGRLPSALANPPPPIPAASGPRVAAGIDLPPPGEGAPLALPGDSA